MAQRRRSWRKGSQNDALGVKQLPLSVVLPPLGGPESGFLESKCTGLTCKDVIPTRGRKHFFKRVKMFASAGKRGKKWELEDVMHMLGAVVG